MEELETTRLMFDMLTRPDEHQMNCHRFAAGLVFNICYGKRMSIEDGDVKAVLSILESFVVDAYPGSHLCDTFPILDKLPGFLAPWRAEANAKHDLEAGLYTRLLNDVKNRMKEDKNMKCFAARLWESNHKNKLDVETLAYSEYLIGTLSYRYLTHAK
jgi:hypothetical protein